MFKEVRLNAKCVSNQSKCESDKDCSKHATQLRGVGAKTESRIPERTTLLAERDVVRDRRVNALAIGNIEVHKI